MKMGCGFFFSDIKIRYEILTFRTTRMLAGHENPHLVILLSWRYDPMPYGAVGDEIAIVTVTSVLGA